MSVVSCKKVSRKWEVSIKKECQERVDILLFNYTIHEKTILSDMDICNHM